MRREGKKGRSRARNLHAPWTHLASVHALLVLALVALVAGCAAQPVAPECRNPQPAGADCSYDISGLAAVARFNETYDADRAAGALREMGFGITLANERAVLAESGDGLRVSVEARDGWFGFVLGRDLDGPRGGLTQDEVDAEGAMRCEEGAGAEMARAVERFEALTGWTRATWEPCRANGGVA